MQLSIPVHPSRTMNTTDDRQPLGCTKGSVASRTCDAHQRVGAFSGWICPCFGGLVKADFFGGLVKAGCT